LRRRGFLIGAVVAVAALVTACSGTPPTDPVETPVAAPITASPSATQSAPTAFPMPAQSGSAGMGESVGVSDRVTIVIHDPE